LFGFIEQAHRPIELTLLSKEAGVVVQTKRFQLQFIAFK